MQTTTEAATHCALVALAVSVDEERVASAIALLEDVTERGGVSADTYRQAIDVLRTTA